MARRVITQAWKDDADPRRIYELSKLGLDANMLPKTLTPAEKEAAMSEVTDVPAVPAPSNLLFKVAAVIMAILGAVAIKQPDLFPLTELDQQIATILMAVIGFLSPGLKKK